MSISSFTSKRRVRGAAMVELAIILMLLVTLFIGISELGRALFFQHKLTKAVEAGARYLGRSWDAVDASGCLEGTGWAAAETSAANMTVFGNAAGTGEAVVPGLVVGDVSASVAARPVTGVGDVCVVRITAAMAYRGIFFGGTDGFLPPVILGGDGVTGWTLTADSEERYVGD